MFRCLFLCFFFLFVFFFFFLCCLFFFFFFFFSSRRRHTRWTGDWSSDVCSSDLGADASRVRERIRDASAPVVRLALLDNDVQRVVGVLADVRPLPDVGDEGRIDRKSVV